MDTVFGRTSKKQSEILELAKEYKVKYSLIEPNLKYEFEYSDYTYHAIVIQKNIKIADFKEEEFQRDLEYLTNLYQEYEVKFENATIPLQQGTQMSLLEKDQMTYEEINERLLKLIEEAGTLAKALRQLSK